MDRSRLRTLPKEDVVGWSAISHPSAVHQAAVGEVLYLKGSRFSGAEGSGAVHRSPDTGGGAAPRLLLKLDAPSSAPAAARRACGAGCSHVLTHLGGMPPACPLALISDTRLHHSVGSPPTPAPGLALCDCTHLVFWVAHMAAVHCKLASKVA